MGNARRAREAGWRGRCRRTAAYWRAPDGAGAMTTGEDSRYLSTADLLRLCDFLYRRTGMLFGETKRYYIDRRAADRVAATGAVSFGSYFNLLLSDPNEAEHLINR